MTWLNKKDVERIVEDELLAWGFSTAKSLALSAENAENRGRISSVEGKISSITADVYSLKKGLENAKAQLDAMVKVRRDEMCIIQDLRNQDLQRISKLESQVDTLEDKVEFLLKEKHGYSVKKMPCCITCNHCVQDSQGKTRCCCFDEYVVPNGVCKEYDAREAKGCDTESEEGEND